MKKLLKITVSLLTLLAILITMGSLAFATDAQEKTEATEATEAAASVVYDGAARSFIFAPGSDRSPTDLFPDFKGIMPGDSLTQQILVRNDASNEVKVKIYLRSLGAQEDSAEFLSQLKLTVSQNGDSILFDAPADQTGTLTDWVCLGTFYSGAEILLDVALEVPLEMGNEFQSSEGVLQWEFKVEEFPVEPEDPVPDTGDHTNLFLYGALFLVSAGLLGMLLWSYKRKKQET